MWSNRILFILPQIKRLYITSVSYTHLDVYKRQPLGFGNPKPYVCLEKLNIDRTFVIGKEENHLKLLVKDVENQLTLLLFRCGEDVGLLKEGDMIDVVGYPDINVWNGKESMQFNVREWRYSN